MPTNAPSSQKACPSCKSDIHADAKKCPNCRTNLQSWPRRHPIRTVFLVVFFILPFSISAIGSIYRAAKGTSDSPSATLQAAPTPEALKASLKAELEQIKAFDGVAMRKAQEAGEQSEELNTFERWGSLVQEGKKSADKETTDLAKELEKKASAIQVKEFPLMRKITGERLGKVLWTKNIEIKLYGSKNETLEFIALMFANNQNISDFYVPVMSDVERMRFRTVRFRWSEGMSGTEFDNNKAGDFPKDGDVVPRAK
ncbi:zinc ribbon domain-containing protein [Patescibacteria group bacterium]|nr:zinc ribbon domain-containing protein [Patescibacteria group bacterium]MBP9710240.1 zinc ribbon domain-containing protein [Patescibacteria group bacterium]